MFILYTIAPMLYRLSSSAYFNLSLLSSDFYGLLFGKTFPPRFRFDYSSFIAGLFLYVSSSYVSENIEILICSLALQALLAILCFLRHCHCWPYNLLLALYP
jgi:hypothetical protein